MVGIARRTVTRCLGKGERRERKAAGVGFHGERSPERGERVDPGERGRGVCRSSVRGATRWRETRGNGGMIDGILRRCEHEFTPPVQVDTLRGNPTFQRALWNSSGEKHVVANGFTHSLPGGAPRDKSVSTSIGISLNTFLKKIPALNCRPGKRI